MPMAKGLALGRTCVVNSRSGASPHPVEQWGKLEAEGLCFSPWFTLRDSFHFSWPPFPYLSAKSDTSLSQVVVRIEGDNRRKVG